MRPVGVAHWEGDQHLLNRCSYHFDQIAEQNEAPEANVIQLVSLTSTDMPHLP
jgi:hypothetical protein